MKRYYYIKFDKTKGDMALMEEVVRQVKHGYYIIDFVYEIEQGTDVDILEIDREQFDMLLNAN